MEGLGDIELRKLADRAMEHFRLYNGIADPSEIRTTDTPGYWEVVGGCPGGKDCRHAWRGVLGPCSGGVRLTLYYREDDARDARGRFVSPYRCWYAWREVYEEVKRDGRDKAHGC